MAIEISQFRNLAQNVDANRSIVLANKGTEVKDRGGFATAFTFKSTHRAATQAFLDSYRAAYGANLGEIAREMVQNDLSAGKPLRASTVTQLLNLADAKERRFRDGVASFLAQGNARLTAIVDEIAAEKYPNATAAQKQEAVKVITTALPALSWAVMDETGSQDVEHNIERAIKEMKTPLLKAGFEIVFNEPSSRLAALGGANASAETKVKALGLISSHGQLLFDLTKTEDARAVSLLLTAACQIPANPDGRVEVTSAKLYAALFPANVFTDAKCAELGMRQYNAAELDLMSRTDFAKAISENLAKLAHDPLEKRAAFNDLLTINLRSADTLVGVIQDMGITGDGSIHYCTKFLADEIRLRHEGVADDRLPTLGRLFEDVKEGRVGLPSLAKLVGYDLKLTLMLDQMTPQTRHLFMDALSSINLSYDITLTPILANRLPQLVQLKAAHPEMSMRAITWQTLFNEPLPQGYEEMDGRDISFAFDHRNKDLLRAMLQEAKVRHAPQGTEVPPLDPDEVYSIFPLIMSELSPEVAVDILANPEKPTRITLADLMPQSVYAYGALNNNTMEAVEKQLAADLHRRGLHGPRMGEKASCRIDLQFPGQGVRAINLDRPEGIGDEELQAYRSSDPTSVTHGIMEQFLAACGGNETQAKSAAICLTQAGAGYLRNLIPSTVLREDEGGATEHSAAICTCTKDDAGNINVRWQNCPESIIRFDYNYQIAPDGRQTLTSFIAERV